MPQSFLNLARTLATGRAKIQPSRLEHGHRCTLARPQIGHRLSFPIAPAHFLQFSDCIYPVESQNRCSLPRTA
jgi:hypothetical protein